MQLSCCAGYDFTTRWPAEGCISNSMNTDTFESFSVCPSALGLLFWDVDSWDQHHDKLQSNMKSFVKYTKEEVSSLGTLISSDFGLFLNFIWFSCRAAYSEFTSSPQARGDSFRGLHGTLRRRQCWDHTLGSSTRHRRRHECDRLRKRRNSSKF
jgi:hypothetical protein